MAEFIERGVKAVADHAALLDGQGRFVHDGAGDQFHEVGRFGELGFELIQERGRLVREFRGGRRGGISFGSGRVENFIV